MPLSCGDDVRQTTMAQMHDTVHAPRARRFRAFAVALLMALALVALQACRSESNTPATPTAAPVVATPTEAAVVVPLPVDPNSFTLQTANGGPNTFEIGVPNGWAPEAVEAVNGFASRWVFTQGRNRIAQITVRCTRDGTVLSMTGEDASLVEHIHGVYELEKAMPITLAGLTGKQVDFSVKLGTSTSDQRTVYLEDPVCGWRITLQVYYSGDRDRYAQLFQRVLGTFRPLVQPGS